MKLEFDALISNGTWVLCPRLALHNIIRNKWVYKIKSKEKVMLKDLKPGWWLRL